MAVTGIHLLDHMQTPSLVIERGQVTFANAAAKSLLGAHIVGQDVRIAIRNPDAIAVILGDTGGSARIDGLSVGGSFWEVDCHILGSGERLVSLYDLSVQVSTARAHADFVANASHELRTPLATVLGYVETLTDPRAGGDEATRNKFLATIRHEALRMQSLVEDLMSLSRIEAVKHEVPSGEVEMLTLIREVAGESRGDAQVVVNANCERAVIAGDKVQMAQVMRNLIDNALKYGKPGGPVTITLEATDTGWLLIAV
ncbi:MAG: two-component sensor histidine kinase, partial [Novosphingobium sp.]|nr:two-component sensor histidine kinase [Novosphingobium sp.]